MLWSATRVRRARRFMSVQPAAALGGHEPVGPELARDLARAGAEPALVQPHDAARRAADALRSEARRDALDELHERLEASRELAEDVGCRARFAARGVLAQHARRT